MRPRFGTDGLRGVANDELTPEVATALGRAAARVLGPTRFLVARDTRLSGPMLHAALAAGLAAEGATAEDVGVLPTPAVAWLAAHEGVPAATISGSHNPFADNGIKLFGPDGMKLADSVEAAIQTAMDAVLDGGDPGGPVAAGVGTVARYRHNSHYQDAMVAALEGRMLTGLRVVIDCAHGAASAVAPEVLRRLGASIEVIHDQPDGTNINARCGSTHPEELQRVVPAFGADVGLAFDGDADRVLAVDHTGALVDGDQLIAMCALDLRDRGLLKGDTVVVTVMTNLGFRLAMVEAGIEVHETKVGDRYVLEALEANGWSLGGEQSGHVIFRELATTGDGLLTGLAVLDLVNRSGRRLADLAASAMTRLPQVLRNVPVARRDDLDGATALWDEVRAVEAELGSRGRVLIRPSGTEPLVRVMVEAETQGAADAACARLVGVVESTLA